MVDPSARREGGEVGSAVWIGQMGKARGVAGYMDAGAADGVRGWVSAVRAVPPGRCCRYR